MRETILLRIDRSAFSGFSAYFAGIPPKTAKAPIYGKYSPLMQEKNDAAESAERVKIMENAKATEAQKLQKYNLAAEIKRKYFMSLWQACRSPASLLTTWACG